MGTGTAVAYFVGDDQNRKQFLQEQAVETFKQKEERWKKPKPEE
jgi:hypothetical protein